MLNLQLLNPNVTYAVMNKYSIFLSVILLTFIGCKETNDKPITNNFKHLSYSKNILNYSVVPNQKRDKSGLMFSDQGAWFAYSTSGSTKLTSFSGPFLLTQEWGVWSSKALANLTIENQNWNASKVSNCSSHLQQVFTNDNLELTQKLVFLSGHSALINTSIKNKSKTPQEVSYSWSNLPILADSLSFSSENKYVKISSPKTEAVGYLSFPDEKISIKEGTYETSLKKITIEPSESVSFTISQTFIFPEYSWEDEQKLIAKTTFDTILNTRKAEKNNHIKLLVENRKKQFQDTIYAEVLAKAVLTMQNNWRIPAGEITFEGMFPSYHYSGFNGFWSWDTWKQAVGVSFYDTRLAKQQMKQMFAFQYDDGFVADVVYRTGDHNLRDTKPPLAAWAVAKIYEKDNDLEFVKYMYPKLKKYHQWWYDKRDHDQDGICEYGSTDGTLIAAKWESGMDNAIRFDDSKIVKNGETAYSLNQESVDLNAYLYAEKLYLAQLANALGNNLDNETFIKEAKTLKQVIQTQFYDIEKGWFYDTNLDGNQFIRGEGSEGWTPLWAKAATQEQAEAVKVNMMNPDKFLTKVPFQTMSADHDKFDPLKGYWRGPNWLDQAYFGVKGLRNYGFNEEADNATVQIFRGAEGLLEKGKAIRENYHPISGKGLNAHNFSWSAAHIIMLLMNE